MARRVLVTAALVLAAGLAAPPAGALTAKQKITKDIVHVWNTHRTHLVGMCAGARAGHVSVLKCFGRRVAGAAGAPTPHTLFAIDSISKTVTATLLALRVRQHSVRLVDRVRKYLPAALRLPVPVSMTLLTLANQHSGLPRRLLAQPASAADVFTQLANCESMPGCPLSAPGAEYHYSNFGFAVLGQILAIHDGFSGPAAWDADALKNVTRPLGMKRTLSFQQWAACCASTFLAARARGTTAAGTPAADPPILFGSPWSNADGGLFSDAVEMDRWLRFSMGQLGPPRLRSAQKLLYATPGVLRPITSTAKIGLAWQINVHGSTRCVYKAGSGGGFSSYMTFVKGRPRGAFVLLNTSNGVDPTTAKPSDLANQILDALPSSGHHPGCTTSTAPAETGPEP